MALLGVQTLIYGVDNLDEAARFYDDFGLVAERSGDDGVDYVLEDGSTLLLRRIDDPALPPTPSDAPGVREVIWGVDSQAALDELEASLSTDRKVLRDLDGTLHTHDDCGIAIGFRVFMRKPLEAITSTENAPGDIRRWNTHRRWVKRAQPRCINHVVFGVPGVDGAVDFYAQRLGFVVTDVSRGIGVFMRCDGRHEHTTSSSCTLPRSSGTTSRSVCRTSTKSWSAPITCNVEAGRATLALVAIGSRLRSSTISTTRPVASPNTRQAPTTSTSSGNPACGNRALATGTGSARCRRPSWTSPNGA